MSLKTQGMNKIMASMADQIRKLKESLSSGEDNLPDSLTVRSGVFEQLHGLVEKFERSPKEDCQDYQEIKNELVTLIDQYYPKNLKNRSTENIHREDCEKLASNFLEKFATVLQNLEKIEWSPLKQSLQDALDYVRDMSAVDEIEDYQNIKELAVSVIELLGPLQRYRKSLISQYLSEKVVLYSSQLCSTLTMLVELVQEQHHLNAPIYNCKKYVCDRMCSCFQLLIDALDSPSPSEEEENSEKKNHFVYRMDLVLDMIAGLQHMTSEEQREQCSDLWLGIEDAFSYAMAIAQVCQPYNFNAITGVSQSIIMEYEKLKNQLCCDKPDPTMNNLFMNTLNDALYRLEQKVNDSVLTMVMEVFSDPVNALRKLVEICGNSLSPRARSKTDLSNAIEEFDQVTDRLMQIGMFAIACSMDVNRVTRIRNCLASLESLELELVPATTAFYLHPDNKELRATVKLLTTQWQREMTKLHNAVNVIIDSGAYCQVVLDDLQQRISAMSDALDNRMGVTRAQVHGILQRALSLSNQVSATVTDIGPDHIERLTIMMIQELKAAIYETGMASKMLLDNATEPQQLRVIKRCELILNVAKRLQPVLANLMNTSSTKYATHRQESMGQGDTLHGTNLTIPGSKNASRTNGTSFTYIRTPYSVQRNRPPVSLQPVNTTPRTMTNISCLIPYIKRGRTMRTSRSIMYKTPRPSEDVDSLSVTKNSSKVNRNLSIVRQHLFSRESFSASQEVDIQSETFDLTAILDQITSLSDTLSTTSSSSFALKSQASPELDSVQAEFETSPHSNADPSIDASDRSMVNFFETTATAQPDECSSVGGGDAPSTIETPDRLGDLRRLDEKIQELQKKS